MHYPRGATRVGYPVSVPRLRNPCLFRGLLHAGEILMAIGKEERTLLQRAEQNVYTLIKATHDFHELLKRESSKLKNTATDMDGANMKLKGKSDGNLQVSDAVISGGRFEVIMLFLFQAKADAATAAYQAQLAKVEEMVSALSDHRDKQRQAAKALLEAQRDFYTSAAGVIDGMIGNVG